MPCTHDSERPANSCFWCNESWQLVNKHLDAPGVGWPKVHKTLPLGHLLRQREGTVLSSLCIYVNTLGGKREVWKMLPGYHKNWHLDCILSHILLWLEFCPLLPPKKKKCFSPNLQDLWIWLCLEIGSLQGKSLGWALICHDWCPYETGHFAKESGVQREDDVFTVTAA